MKTPSLSQHIAGIGRDSVLLFVALSVANASNYTFHLVVSRELGPHDYGALGSVLAILIVLSVPLSAIQATVAKRVVKARRGGRADAQVWVSAIRSVLPAGIVLASAVALFSPVATAFLRLDSVVTTLLVSAYVIPALLASVLRGALQGSLRFPALAVGSVVPALLRVATGVMLVRSGGGVAGAVAASVVAELAGIGALLWLLPPSLRTAGGDARPTGSLLPEVAPVAAGLAAMWVLIELDLVLARHFLSGAEAGSYAAAGILARAVLFVPGAVSLIALPRFSEHRARGSDAYRYLASASLTVVVVGGLVALGFTMMADTVVGVTFGGRFADAAGLLPIMSWAMVGLGLANVLLFFFVAADSRMYHLLWPAAAVQATIIAMNHGSGRAIALATLVVSWTVAVVGFITARAMALSKSPLSRLPVDLEARPSAPEATDMPELSVIVPCYNTGPRLVTTVDSVVSCLNALNRAFEVIVVSDGGTDGAEGRLGASERVSVVRYQRRQGKGVALRVGLMRARGRHVAFIDGDGDLDAADLGGFLTIMDLYDSDLVIGSKRHPLSKVHYPATRRVMSWTYQRVVHLLFGLNVRDTQTGMKLIRRDVLDAVLPRMVEKRFAFDLEFLVVAKSLGFQRVFEAPIHLNHRFSSTVSTGAVLGVLLDTCAIFYRRYLLRCYNMPLPTSTVTWRSRPAGHGDVDQSAEPATLRSSY